MWWEHDHGYLAPSCLLRSDDESALRTRVHTATAQRLTNYSQTVSGVSNLKMKRFSLEWFTVVWSAYIYAVCMAHAYRDVSFALVLVQA